MAEESLHLRRPTLEDFVYEGEEVPLLFRGRVLLGIAAALLLVVVLSVIAFEVLNLSLEIDAEPLRDWVEQWGIWAPIVFMALMAASVLFAPIPNVPIFIAAGLIWGPVLGTLYSQVGLVGGSVVAFYVSRWAGRRHLPRLVGAKAARRIDNLAEHMGGRILFVARLVPVVNFDIISFAAGLTAIGFRAFFIATFFGTLIPTVLAVVAGDALESNLPLTIGIGVFWVAGLLLSAGYFWYRGRRRRRVQPPPAAETGEQGA